MGNQPVVEGVGVHVMLQLADGVLVEEGEGEAVDDNDKLGVMEGVCLTVPVTAAKKAKNST